MSMTSPHRSRSIAAIQGLCVLGGFLAALAGAALAALHAVRPEDHWLPSVTTAAAILFGGFLVLGLLGTLAAVMRSLNPILLQSAPTPAATAGPKTKTGRYSARDQAGLATLYQQVKTYIDLEMWELACEKANEVIRRFPDSEEASVLAKNLNELRWKAEPKFLSGNGGPPDSEDESRKVERGLRQMVEQVRTYMELEMWELARQKALAIMKNFPDAPQSDEIARLFPEIDRRFSGPAPQAPPWESVREEKSRE